MKSVKKILGVLSVGAMLSLAAASAKATNVDLTTAGASGTINGALYVQDTSMPTGTGYIDSFLRMEALGNATSEQGYNTSVRPVEFDEKTDANFTRPLLLTNTPLVTVNGTLYRQFYLDINEPSSQNSRFLTMDNLEIYQSVTGAVSGYTANHANLGTQIYGMDIGADSQVLMDATLGVGSGHYDAIIYIPNSLFNQNTPYVVLYAKFGGTDYADGGFEEFAVKHASNQIAIPVPAAASTGIATLGLIGLVGAIRKIKASIA